MLESEPSGPLLELKSSRSLKFEFQLHSTADPQLYRNCQTTIDALSVKLHRAWIFFLLPTENACFERSTETKAVALAIPKKTEIHHSLLVICLQPLKRETNGEHHAFSKLTTNSAIFYYKHCSHHYCNRNLQLPTFGLLLPWMSGMYSLIEVLWLVLKTKCCCLLR